MAGVMSGDDFAKRREGLGMTQAELSEAFGVNRVTIAKWESDRLPIRRVTVLALERLEQPPIRKVTLALERLEQEHKKKGATKKSLKATKNC